MWDFEIDDEGYLALVKEFTERIQTKGCTFHMFLFVIRMCSSS